jgi:hypothetical protein
MEIVGEFLGIDTERGHLHLLPSPLRQVVSGLKKGSSYDLLAPSGLSLWVVKRMLWKDLLGRIRFDPEVSLIDSCPVPVCRFARAYRCKRLADSNRPLATTR